MDAEPLTVAQVRRALSVLRRRWAALLSGRPVDLYAPLDIEQARTIDAETFALRFITGTAREAKA